MIFCVVFFHFMLPETKNRNLLEVEAEVARLPRIPCCGQRQCYDTSSMYTHNVISLPTKNVF